MQKFDYDVAIVGGGSGGFAAARTVAGAGLRAIVIEGGEEVGGLCILRGCMPTKALLYAAEIIHLARDTAPWGLRNHGFTFDFAKAMERKNAVIKDFADYRVQQLKEGKFEFVRAHARFVDPHTLELIPMGSSEREFAHSKKANQSRLTSAATITAKYFVIATGSHVAPTPLPELRDVGYLTSDDALNLSKLPKSMIVLGGGAIGCEFAQFMSRFGTKITLIQRSPHVLHDFDTDVAAEIEKVFVREGVELFTSTKLFDAKIEDGLKKVTFDCRGKMTSASAEEILFALGRVPNTVGIGLDKAGVKMERGRIVCDESMQTTAPHIFAAGDCVGPHDIVHLAVLQGETAGQNIVKYGSRKMDYRLSIEIVFTDPHIAQVGLTEKRAKAENIPYLAASYPFGDHGKSIIMEARDGFVKLLCDPKSGEILGGTCIGPAGGELIHEIVVAMAKRMTAQELAAIPHYHPTLAEVWTYPAEELAGKIMA